MSDFKIDFCEAERVAACAELLDKLRPGWEQEIDLSVLSMAVGNYDEATGIGCIVCQLTKMEFWEGLAVLGIDKPRQLGLVAITAGQGEYQALDEAWIALIKERFSSGNLSRVEHEHCACGCGAHMGCFIWDNE